MRLAEMGFTNGQAALEERLGLGESPGVLVEQGQTVERERHLEMLPAEHRLAHLEAALQQGLGLAITTDRAIKQREVGQGSGNADRVLGVLLDGEATLEQALRLFILPKLQQQ